MYKRLDMMMALLEQKKGPKHVDIYLPVYTIINFVVFDLYPYIICVTCDCTQRG
jgi:hypothetical protein